MGAATAPLKVALVVAFPALLIAASAAVVRRYRQGDLVVRAQLRWLALAVAGQQLKAGDKVGLFYCSANRDEAAFDQPEAFNLQRSPNPHLGFGGGGPHFCLGNQLARTSSGTCSGSCCSGSTSSWVSPIIC